MIEISCYDIVVPFHWYFIREFSTYDITYLENQFLVISDIFRHGHVTEPPSQALLWQFFMSPVFELKTVFIVENKW